MRIARPNRKSHKKKVVRTWRAYIALSKKIIVILIIGLCFILWFSNYNNILYNKAKNRLLDNCARAGFRIEEILVKGRQHTQQNEILSSIKVWKNQPIFACDLQEIRQNLQKIGWVKDATVQRILPNKLNIIITERNHIALWQHQKNFFIVDDSGNTIAIQNPKAFSNLPLLIGTEAPKNASNILQILEKYPELKAQIINITFIRQRRWNLNLIGDIVIKLPSTNVAEAVASLENLRILNKIVRGEVISIDLRALPQISIRLTTDSAKKIMTINKGNIT